MLDSVLYLAFIVSHILYLYVGFYALYQLYLLILCLSNKQEAYSRKALETSTFPYITIQLPVYNEPFVIQNLLQNILKIQYPKDKIEIQILDDSTDNTSTLIKKYISDIQYIDIAYIHRKQRTGYKAGALMEGLKIAKGELIAVFDADFLPKQNFLLQTIPYFNNPKIGLLQTKWGYKNSNYNLLTQLQSIGLNHHFSIEQRGRNLGDYYINFNGTAGIWRKCCILDSGNWSSETLTEDLDLSYRAQLYTDWKCIYNPNIVCPSELPVTVDAIKSQQFRWMKGGTQCFKKLIAQVIKHSTNRYIKLMSFFHLSSVFIFVFMALHLIAYVPYIYISSVSIAHPILNIAHKLCLYSGVCSAVIIISCYMYSCAIHQKHRSIVHSIIHFRNTMLFFCVSIALSINNSIAIFEGIASKGGIFIRTPKIGNNNIKNISKTFKSISFKMIFEICFFIYCIFSIFISYFLEIDISFLHIMYCIGTSILLYYSIKHRAF